MAVWRFEFGEYLPSIVVHWFRTASLVATDKQSTDVAVHIRQLIFSTFSDPRQKLVTFNPFVYCVVWTPEVVITAHSPVSLSLKHFLFSLACFINAGTLKIVFQHSYQSRLLLLKTRLVTVKIGKTGKIPAWWKAGNKTVTRQKWIVSIINMWNLWCVWDYLLWTCD